MKTSAITRVIYWYLLCTPIVASLNGLSQYVLGISILGPLYHTIVTLSLIFLGLAARQVQKNRLFIIVVFGSFIILITAQLALGYSDLSDLGQLYKYYMPLMLFAVYYRWKYLGEVTIQQYFMRLFENIPLLYSALIFFSFVAYYSTGFTASPWTAGERFTGFIFAYNGTVNAFLICAYINLILLKSSAWKKGLNGAAFFLLNSKTVLVYYALIGWSFIKRYMGKRKKQLVGVVVIGVPVLVLSAWFGYGLAARSAYSIWGQGQKGKLPSVGEFSQFLQSVRVEWWDFMIRDVSIWPTTNLMFGNGFNVIRQGNSPLWADHPDSNLYIATRYSYKVFTKSDKAFEFDGLAQLDLFGFPILALFVVTFYLYPLWRVRLPYFRIYYLGLILISLFSGQILNNPQVSPLLVFFIIILKAKSAQDGAGRTKPVNPNDMQLLKKDFASA